jgi:hypothetical protein
MGWVSAVSNCPNHPCLKCLADRQVRVQTMVRNAAHFFPAFEKSWRMAALQFRSSVWRRTVKMLKSRTKNSVLLSVGRCAIVLFVLFWDFPKSGRKTTVLFPCVELGRKTSEKVELGVFGVELDELGKNRGDCFLHRFPLSPMPSSDTQS